MFAHSLLSGIGIAGRVYRFRVTGIPALILILVWLAAAVGIGFWAGKVAQDKGKGFGAFFALGILLSLCGILPGLVVVIIAYAMSAEPGYATGATAAGPPPVPSGPAYQPPPVPGAPPVPPAPPAGQASPSPQGGYQYQPGAAPPQPAPPGPRGTPGPPPPPPPPPS